MITRAMNRKRLTPPRSAWMWLALLLLRADPGLAADEPFDLILRGGRIVDGSGNPWFHGDVAVRGDRITHVGRVPPGNAKRDIDARGLVVAPYTAVGGEWSRMLVSATYAEPFQYNDGIEYVVVNGGVVLEKGRHTGARPGRVLRRR